MSDCSDDAGTDNIYLRLGEISSDIMKADCPCLKLFWLQMNTCQRKHLYSTFFIQNGEVEDIFNESENERDKVKPRFRSSDASHEKAFERWNPHLSAYKPRKIKFPCESEEDSGITIPAPDVSTSTDNVDIQQNKCPSLAEVEINNTYPSEGNFVTMETQSGLRIEAENIQLKWQRGVESLTIRSLLGRTKSKLSIKTPDGNHIRGIHGEEVQIQTQSETICLTPL
jgi:hypothetical protein